VCEKYGIMRGQSVCEVRHQKREKCVYVCVKCGIMRMQSVCAVRHHERAKSVCSAAS
jgi:hypothetical protein